MTDPRHELGRRAERAVAGWLTREGWRILDLRWRASGGELDLVCLDPAGVLVGVEVKLRRTGRTGSGAESVDRRRVGRLRAALAAYAAGGTVVHRGIRLDLVTLVPAGAGRWRVRRLPGIDAW
jgi:Holliday junction resolvase-like predicted endonuclease